MNPTWIAPSFNHSRPFVVRLHSSHQSFGHPFRPFWQTHFFTSLKKITLPQVR
ncbi:unnamed protein product, partial [Sphagnum troendelagicum]